MAITRAQQYRQMLKDGKVAMQGGVKNYLGKQKTVSDVPLKWQSGPDKPSTELAYITKAEKDLLLKKDIHGSLKDGPNTGPKGIMSLDSQGDADTYGQTGQSYGDRQTTDSSPEVGDIGGGYQDSGYDDRRKEREKDPYYGTSLEGSGVTPTTSVATKEQEKEAKKEARKFRRETKKTEDARRKSKLRAILAKKKTYNTFKIDPKTGKPVVDETINLAGYDEEGNPLQSNNPFGISNVEYQDLISSLPSGSSLNINPMETDAVNEEIRQKAVNDYLAKNISSTNLDDPLNQLMEKNDRFSGVNLEAFQNEFNLPKTGLTGLDIALGFAEPFLRKNSKKTKEFFSGTEDGLGKNIFGKDRKSVLEAGKYTIDGMPISAEQFAMLDPALMDDVYKDYTGRRLSGEIDAYGNPMNLNTGGGNEQQTDPCKGPNPPAYCFVNNTTEEEDPRQILSTRILGSQFDPTFFANEGGRAALAEGGMPYEGGIMDLESGRQMYFLGKLVKKATRAVKKIAKSPIGKAAILGGLAYFGGGGGLPKFLSGKGLGGFSTKTLFSKANPLLFTDGKFSMGKFGLLSAATPFLFPEEENNNDDLARYLASQELIPGTTKRQMGSEFDFYKYNLAEGGMPSKEPVAKKTMPLLDMDGQEMDLRAEGGFVPIGRMERADDVPARLSKNEFVFTADAVRNAGEGDIDKGAEVMYNMMKNLESGGEVSEESQGLDGAREMFQTSKRLEEVL